MTWEETEALLRRAGAHGDGLDELRRRWHGPCPECHGRQETIAVVGEQVIPGATVLACLGWQVCPVCSGRGWVR